MIHGNWHYSWHPFCRRAFTWSTSRGGCRFAPGHNGDCKPGRRY